MRTRFQRIGNDLVLVLDKTILDQLGLDETSEVDVSVRDNALVITPVSDLPPPVRSAGVPAG